jgi:hypothetical protein
VSHKSSHIIISFALPHDDDDEEAATSRQKIRKEPSVFLDAPEGCTEEDCAELARLGYRKLVGD